jgi:hypothetical protein
MTMSRSRFSDRFLPSGGDGPSGIRSVAEDQVATGLDALGSFFDDKLFKSGVVAPDAIFRDLDLIRESMPASTRGRDLTRLMDIRVAMDRDGGQVSLDDLSFLIEVMRDDERGLKIVGGLVASRIRDAKCLDAVIEMAKSDPDNRKHWAVPLAAIAAGGAGKAWSAIAAMALEGAREDRMAALRAVLAIGLSGTPDGRALVGALAGDPDIEISGLAKDASSGDGGGLHLAGIDASRAIAAMGMERMAIGAELRVAEAAGDKSAIEALRVLRNDLDANLAAASESIARSSMAVRTDVIDSGTMPVASVTDPSGPALLGPDLVADIRGRMIAALRELRHAASSSERMELSSRISDYGIMLRECGMSRDAIADVAMEADSEDASGQHGDPTIAAPTESPRPMAGPPPPGWASVFGAVSEALASPFDDDLIGAAIAKIVAHGGQAAADGSMWIMHAGTDHIRRLLLNSIAREGSVQCLGAVGIGLDDPALAIIAAKAMAGIAERCGASHPIMGLAERAMGSPDPEVRAQAVCCLSVQPMAKARDLIVRAMADPSGKVAMMAKAAYSSRLVNSNVDVNAACAMLDAGAKGIEASLLMGHVGRDRSEDAMRALVRYCGSGRKDLVRLAIMELGKRQEPAAKAVLSEMYKNSEDAAVRDAARSALGPKLAASLRVSGYVSALAARVMPRLMDAWRGIGMG